MREVTEQREIETLRVLFAPAPYWEPPVAETEPRWPLHQLRAFRWTAAVIAYSVRNALETLHIRYTSNESMPPLNRGIRNTVYVTLLRRPDGGLAGFLVFSSKNTQRAEGASSCLALLVERISISVARRYVQPPARTSRCMTLATSSG